MILNNSNEWYNILAIFCISSFMISLAHESNYEC